MNFTKNEIDSLILEAVNNINNGVSKTLTARTPAETPPQDTRHLTDTRTRVSTLLEYALSYELNMLLLNQNEGNSISNVLWNVFPDLIVRDEHKNNRMGLEVKALHTAAEEMSANLSTSLPVIRKGKDLVVILIWGWVRELHNGVHIIYPHIHKHYSFDAWLLAKMRDTTWLLKEKGRIKGIDINTSILNDGGSTSVFKAEEGNMGKLMRISLSLDTDENVPFYEEMLHESETYEEFKKEAIGYGFIETIKDICYECHIEPIFTIDQPICPEEATQLAYAVMAEKNIFFVAGKKSSRLRWSDILINLEDGDMIVTLGEKLNWKIILNATTEIIIDSGAKPDIEIKSIQQALINNN